MALMKIQEYIETQFTPASAPDRRTVRNWIQRGDIYGERLGRDWYVDPTRPVQPAPEAANEPAIQSPLAKRVINGE